MLKTNLIYPTLVGGLFFFNSAFACENQDSAVSINSNIIVKMLKCSNKKEIEKSLNSWLQPLEICNKILNQMNYDKRYACKAAASLTLSHFNLSLLPASWECPVFKTEPNLNKALEEACSTLQ